jgi:hypothetical protein
MKTTNLLSCSLFCASLIACGGASKDAQSPPAETAPTETAPTESETPSEAISDLALAQSVAEATQPTWDAEKATAEEVTFTLKITVNGKPAALAAKGAELSVLLGAEAAAPADFVVELSSSQAQAIIDGSTTLKSLIASNDVSSDNAEGLKRFAEFLQN